VSSPVVLRQPQNLAGRGGGRQQAARRRRQTGGGGGLCRRSGVFGFGCEKAEGRYSIGTGAGATSFCGADKKPVAWTGASGEISDQLQTPKNPHYAVLLVLRTTPAASSEQRTLAFLFGLVLVRALLVIPRQDWY
jgi:hypothetical protein